MGRSFLIFVALQLLTISTIFSQNLINNRTIRPFRYTLFHSPSNIYIAFDKNYKPNILTQTQLAHVKWIIKKVADSLNFLITSTNVRTGKIDTLKHVFQIVSAKTNKGHKVIWVNAVCDPPKDWHKRLLFVEDGGSCYFDFKIDLDKSKYFDLRINASG